MTNTKNHSQTQNIIFNPTEIPEELGTCSMNNILSVSMKK